MNFEDWQYHENKLPGDVDEKTKYLDELTARFKEELQANKAAVDWMANYNYQNKEEFLESYVRMKINLVRYSAVRIKEAEQIPEFRFRKETDEALDMLLQKKLFDLECRWRAGAIELPGIRVCFDFFNWRRNIRNFPFPEPVTPEELELLRRFVLTDDFWDGNWDATNVARGMHYDQIIKRDEEGDFSAMPDWYEYYDLYMGTGHVLLLPDIKRPLEKIYQQACWEKEQAQKSPSPTVPAAEATPASTPYIPSSNPFKRFEEYYQLASCFEDKYFKRLIKTVFEKQQQIRNIEGEDENAEDYVVLMRDIPNLPPVRGGLNWRKALRWCYQDYISSVIHADLPAIHEEYMLYRNMGIRTTSEDSELTRRFLDMGDEMVEQILDGREFLGEPRNLDF